MTGLKRHVKSEYLTLMQKLARDLERYSVVSGSGLVSESSGIGKLSAREIALAYTDRLLRDERETVWKWVDDVVVHR